MRFNVTVYPLPLPTPRFIANALRPRVRRIGDTFNPVYSNVPLSNLMWPTSGGGTFDPNSGVPKVISLNVAPTIPNANPAAPAPMSTGEKVAIGAGAVGAIGLLVWALRHR